MPVAGQSFLQRLRSKTAPKAKAPEKAIDPQAGVEKTEQLYRIPRVDLQTDQEQKLHMNRSHGLGSGLGSIH